MFQIGFSQMINKATQEILAKANRILLLKYLQLKQEAIELRALKFLLNRPFDSAQRPIR